jgi:hypothetical protein
MRTKPLVLGLLALVGCSGPAPIDAPAAAPSVKSLRARGIQQPRQKLAPFIAATAADAPEAQLQYFGGPILQSVNVYAVYWGENVSGETVRAIPDYYRTVLGDGPFMQMLSEYDTTSPAQTIGHGTFAGEIVDADAPIPSKGTPLTDQRIRAELSRLIDLGQLPAQNEHNLFMIYFPPGVDVIDPNNEHSCVDFCAYHNAFQRNGDDVGNIAHNVYYGVFPHFGDNGCQAKPGPQPSLCGFDPDNLTNLEVVSSHELVEAITDAAIGVPNPTPNGVLGWNDLDFFEGEIGDICEFFPDGHTKGVNVQLFWSNEDRACRDHRPTTNLLFDVSPATQTVSAGSAATFAIRLAPPTAGAVNQDPVTFAIRDKGAPVGTLLPASFAPAAITVGQSTVGTLPIAADEPSQVKNVAVSGIDSNGVVHYATATFTITTAPPVISDVSPREGKSIGGTQVTLRGERLSPQLKVQVGSGGVFVPALVKTTQDPRTKVVTATVTTPGFAIPKGAESARVQIIVTNPDGKTGSAEFTYVRCDDERPKVTIVDTPSGPIAGGTIVGVIGANFGASAKDANGNFVEPTVLFGGQPAKIIDMDPTNSNSLVVMTPPVSAAGVVAVVVVNANGEASGPFARFAYGPDSPPQLDHKAPLSVDHGSRNGGTYVSLLTDVATAPLDANATVTFGGQPATIKTVNDFFAGLITPPHAPGVVDVVITNADGQRSIAKRAFRYE